MLPKGIGNQTKTEGNLVDDGFLKKCTAKLKDVLCLPKYRKPRYAWNTVKTEGKSRFSLRAVRRFVTKQNMQNRCDILPKSFKNGAINLKKADQKKDVEKRVPKVEQIAILTPPGEASGEARGA